MRLIASSVRRLRHLRVHLRQRIVALDDSEQREQVGQRVLKRAIEDRHLAGDLFAPCALIVFAS